MRLAQTRSTLWIMNGLILHIKAKYYFNGDGYNHLIYIFPLLSVRNNLSLWYVDASVFETHSDTCYFVNDCLILPIKGKYYFNGDGYNYELPHLSFPLLIVRIVCRFWDVYTSVWDSLRLVLLCGQSSRNAYKGWILFRWGWLMINLLI